MQTQILTEETLLSLQKRFSYFHHSVVESWAIDWVEDDSSATRVRAQISVRDYENYEEDSIEVWQQVVLVMEKCELVRLTDSNRAYYRVTANGIYILIEQNEKTMFGVDFGHFNHSPTSISELMESPCCVVCSRLSLEVL